MFVFTAGGTFFTLGFRGLDFFFFPPTLVPPPMQMCKPNFSSKHPTSDFEFLFGIGKDLSPWPNKSSLYTVVSLQLFTFAGMSHNQLR